MPGPQRYVDAREAADMLGISVATLYAYVSRGLIRSEPGDANARARRYVVDDVAALLARKEYRREPAKAAETALTYGMPVLDSAITLIEGGKLFYRGYDVLTLAQERSFEEVAALLWTGQFEAQSLFSAEASASAATTGPSLVKDYDNPIELYQAMLALTSTNDLAAHQHTPATVAKTGARILRLLTSATTDHPTNGSLAETLQQAWAPEDAQATALLSAALILCADHELNISTFTARCVASAGSSPYAVVIAALAALQGHKHGGHTVRAATLLTAATGGVRQAIAGYLKGGDNIPGFGHPLYPDGDPRGRLLQAMLTERYPHTPGVRLANALSQAVYDILGLRPTVDFALAALAAGIRAPGQSPLAIFALGRTAGWIAHAIEQYALDQLIRPRARYVGPGPR